MKNYTHLTEEEREKIAALLQDGKTQREIASLICRSASTISRELKRNKTMIGRKNNNNPEAKKYLENSYYFPRKAQEKYLKRRKESKQMCPLKTINLYYYVIEYLQKCWTPQLISGRAKLEGKGNISHECIYQFIYSKDARHLKLWEYLPRHHKKRQQKRLRKYKRTLIPNRIDISERPKAVEDRNEFGHWEDDSVVGVGKGAALNTKRERMTRYMMITKIPRKTAKATRLATCKRFKSLPLLAKKTNTADNGAEFTQHEKTAIATGLKFYFATPYHSWERGTNENGNGLIRRFLPKRTDFDKISKKQIKDIEDWINHRPMKCLNYKTPHEAFHEQLLLIEQNF